MSTSLILTIVFLGVFLAYAVGAPVLTNIGTFLHRTWLFCPERDEYAHVGIHPLGAALSTGYGTPHLKVRACTLRKPGETCDQRCLENARF